MKRIVLPLSLFLVFSACSITKSLDAPVVDSAASQANFVFEYDEIDEQVATDIKQWLSHGEAEITRFFGQPFINPFLVKVHSHRDSLDKQWQQDWGMPDFKSQCWMVASGVEHRLDILSPRVWDTQACEHSSSDTVEVAKLITHELVHVFHDQINPSREFIGVDNISWLIEGVAVYASGQLDEERLNDAQVFLATDQAPQSLDQIWSGSARYGLAGSLVAFVDRTYGRDKLLQIMKLVSAEAVLEFLGTSEDDLLNGWLSSMSG